MNERMIELTSEPRGNLITVVNYDHYQDPVNYERTSEQTNEETNSEPRANQCRTPINKKVKKGDNVKKEEPFAFFNAFWELYPKKTTKKETKEYCTKMQLDGDLDRRILTALERQITAKAAIRQSGQFTPEFPDPIRWLKKERWEDEITEASNGDSPSGISDTERKKLQDMYEIC